MEENKQPIETSVEETQIESALENAEHVSIDEVQPKTKPSVEYPRSTNGLVIGIALGMVIGILIGFLLKQMPIWIVGGILLGGAVGFLLDLRVDRRRKENAEAEEAEWEE